jgi:hypothetical protein
LERQQKNRPAPVARKTAPANKKRPAAHRAQLELPSAPNRRDPFDITMPSELLDSVGRTPPREEEMPPASVRRVRPARSPRPRTRPAPRVLEAPAAAAPEVEAPRPPAVSLREGEQVVRASGSGVVIRRARTA